MTVMAIINWHKKPTKNVMHSRQLAGLVGRKVALHDSGHHATYQQGRPERQVAQSGSTERSGGGGRAARRGTPGRGLAQLESVASAPSTRRRNARSIHLTGNSGAECSQGQTWSLPTRQRDRVEFSAPVSTAPVLCGGLKDPVSCTCKALGVGAVTQ